jgi:hypothetical protein
MIIAHLSYLIHFGEVEFKLAGICRIPGLIAFLPKHLLPEPVRHDPPERACTEIQENGLSEED